MRIDICVPYIYCIKFFSVLGYSWFSTSIFSIFRFDQHQIENIKNNQKVLKGKI